VDVNESGASGGLTRRELLRRGLRLGGAAWAIPVVQVLNMSPAQASGYHPTPGPSPHSPHSPGSPNSPRRRP
jgi:hypothetical protein